MRDFKRRLSGNSRHVCGKYDPICKIKHQLEGDFKSQWGGHDIKLLIKVLLKAIRRGGAENTHGEGTSSRMPSEFQNILIVLSQVSRNLRRGGVA